MELTQDILQAFGVSGEPERLPGGEGSSYLVGGVVFKPVGSELETNWRSDVLSGLTQTGFRLAQPVKTRDNTWTYHGWEAATYVSGSVVKGRWKEKIAVCRLFHEAIKSVDRPSFLKTATHPWAVADRMIWGEQDLIYGSRLAEVMGKLEELRRPLDLPNQLIHGDMSGNILFSNDGDPVIIDFSPYWRPAEYATAIIIIDSIVWEGAPDLLIEEMLAVKDGPQLLVRAAMWRIKTTEEYIAQFGKGTIEDVDAYHHVIEILTEKSRSA